VKRERERERETERVGWRTSVSVTSLSHTTVSLTFQKVHTPEFLECSSNLREARARWFLARDPYNNETRDSQHATLSTELYTYWLRETETYRYIQRERGGGRERAVIEARSSQRIHVYSNTQAQASRVVCHVQNFSASVQAHALRLVEHGVVARIDCVTSVDIAWRSHMVYAPPPTHTSIHTHRQTQVYVQRHTHTHNKYTYTQTYTHTVHVVYTVTHTDRHAYRIYLHRQSNKYTNHTDRQIDIHTQRERGYTHTHTYAHTDRPIHTQTHTHTHNTDTQLTHNTHTHTQPHNTHTTHTPHNIPYDRRGSETLLRCHTSAHQTSIMRAGHNAFLMSGAYSLVALS